MGSHLHTHTHAILDAVCKPKELIRKPKSLSRPQSQSRTPAILLCDWALQTHQKSPVKAIYGCEMWLWPDGIDTLTPRSEDGGWQSHC